MIVVGSIVGAILLLPPTAFAVARNAPKTYRWIVCWVNHLRMWLQDVAMMPKIKIAIGFFQTTTFTPDVYGLALPGWYYDWVRFLNVFQIDWSGLTVPGECLEGGFHSRILLRGIGPLVLLLIIGVVGWAGHEVYHYFDRAKADPTFSKGRPCLSNLLKTQPFVLFFAFVLITPTSSGIFAAWMCATYTLNSISGTKITFLIADLSLKCDSSDGNYSRVETLAYIFVCLWSIGLPLLFLLLVFQCRAAILQGRMTRLVRSTAFLHKEYKRQYFWWEVIFLLQRTFVIGFVQWIPHTMLFVRTLFGMLASFAYLMCLFLARPYKRNDVSIIAFGVQSATILILVMALCIQLFTSLQEVDPKLATRILGFQSMASLVATVIVTNLGLLLIFVGLTVYHTVFRKSMRVLRLVSSREVPDLELGIGMQYHVFLSHIWSSGQDQTANIKRMLQLLLPGANIFLDVDDLEEIGDLEKYVRASQCVLIFLSKDYFFSPNCLREVDAALKGDKPLILVHETNMSKGGLPLDQLRANCQSKDRMAVFEKGSEVLPWHRVSEFQLLTLQMIAARVLHRMPLYASLQEPPKLYLSGDISTQPLELPRPVKLYVSKHNPGAKEMMAEFINFFGNENLTLVFDAPSELRPNVARRENTDVIVGTLRRLSSHHDATQVTHMLLYLNDKTFVGEERDSLEHEVQQTREHGIEILLVHENENGRGGCLFEKFFETTPQELIGSGIYKKIAVACHPGPHRPVSLALIAKELGAVPKKSKVMAAISSSRSSSRKLGSKARSLTKFFTARSSDSSTELGESSAVAERSAV